MVFSRPTSAVAALQSVIFGVLFAMFFLYLIIYLPEIITGNHVLDMGLIRGMAVIAIAVIGFGAWENRELG